LNSSSHVPHVLLLEDGDGIRTRSSPDKPHISTAHVATLEKLVSQAVEMSQAPPKRAKSSKKKKKKRKTSSSTKKVQKAKTRRKKTGRKGVTNESNPSPQRTKKTKKRSAPGRNADPVMVLNNCGAMEDADSAEAAMLQRAEALNESIRSLRQFLETATPTPSPSPDVTSNATSRASSKSKKKSRKGSTKKKKAASTSKETWYTRTLTLAKLLYPAAASSIRQKDLEGSRSSSQTSLTQSWSSCSLNDILF